MLKTANYLEAFGCDSACVEGGYAVSTLWNVVCEPDCRDRFPRRLFECYLFYYTEGQLKRLVSSSSVPQAAGKGRHAGLRRGTNSACGLY